MAAVTKENVIGPEQLEDWLTRSPFHKWLGLSLSKLNEDELEIGLTWREEFIAHPRRRYTHGGILAAAIDLAADFAIAAKLGRTFPTVDLRVDYHRAATPGDLKVRAKVIRLGRTFATAEAYVYNIDEELLASGRGVFVTAAPPKREAAHPGEDEQDDVMS